MKGRAEMLPVLNLRISLGSLLAADVPTLAPVAANKIALIAADFTPSESLVLADLTFAAGTGMAPIAGVAGAQIVGNDPITQEQVITIKAPAGGWHWISSVPFTVPDTLFGYALTNGAGTVLLGVTKLDQPITIGNTGDFFDAGEVDIRFVLQPMS
jgi:hypothetical protein